MACGVTGHDARILHRGYRDPLPISGPFSTAQKAVHETVNNALRAAIDAVRPNNACLEPGARAGRVLSKG